MRYTTKLLALLTSITTINVYADANATVQDPYGTMYQRQVRAIANHYDFVITNTTDHVQSYHLHAELCPASFTCKSRDQDVTLNPNEHITDNFNIQMDVGYSHAGIYPVYASLVIIGDSKLDIRRNGSIYVNA